MIKSVTVTNYLGESLKMELTNPYDSGIAITDITGIGPGKADINVTELTSSDGSLYNSARLGTRNIVMTLRFMIAPDIETVRQKSYKYFPIKKELILTFETDNRSCYIAGYVESNEPVIINMSGEASIVGTSRRFNVPAEDIPITNDAVIEPVRCNILPARPSGGVSGTYALDAPGISLQNNQSVSQPNINIRVPGCKTLEEIKAWLTDNPLTVYYQSTSYNGANGLDICLTEYQNGSIELDGTESNLQFFSEYQTLAIKGITTAGDPSQANAYTNFIIMVRK